MSRKLIEIASEIVQNQVSQTHMTAGEIGSALRQVFGTLCELQRAETSGIDFECTQPVAEVIAATLKPEDSIQNDKVICLECGAEMRQLTYSHLASHGMSTKEYKKKYGFTMGTPLAAKSSTRAKSKAAKKRGLPENLKKLMDASKEANAEAAKPAVTPSLSDNPRTVRANRVKSLFRPKKGE